MIEHIAETICDYIKLAEEELFEEMKNALECGEIDEDNTSYIHFCLENIKHLKEMKAEMAEYHHDDAVSAVQEKETDVHLHNSNIDIHKDSYTHKSAFGGV